MGVAKCISLFKECRTRKAITMYTRQRSGLAATIEKKSYAERMSQERQFELENSHASHHLNSKATLAPSMQFESFSKAEEPYERVFSYGNIASESSTSRVWKSAPRTLDTYPQESFTIISFNILASALANKHRYLYTSVQTFHLQWRRRREKIIQGMDTCCPDIICLQEVDKFADVEEILASRGYIGLYKGRTGDMPDGCAIFWRKNRFRLLQERSFEFSMLGMRNNVAQLCALQLVVPDGAINPLSRCNGEIQSHCLVVGNIHVLYNPKRGDIKLGQCRAFLEQVHNMSTIWHGAPVVIGGDFNSTPSSAVYKYLATSELELANLDRTHLSGLVPQNLATTQQKSGQAPSVQVLNAVDKAAVQEETLDNPDASTALSLDEKCDGDWAAVPASNLEFKETMFVGSSDSVITTEVYGEFVQDKHSWNVEELRVATGKDDCTLVRHDLNLFSTYSDIQGCSDTRDAQGEPLLTACHDKFLGTVDYIWRNDGLKTLRVLDTLPPRSLAKNKGLPIKVWGSDHLPLVCELAFT